MKKTVIPFAAGALFFGSLAMAAPSESVEDAITQTQDIGTKVDSTVTAPCVRCNELEKQRRAAAKPDRLERKEALEKMLAQLEKTQAEFGRQSDPLVLELRSKIYVELNRILSSPEMKNDVDKPQIKYSTDVIRSFAKELERLQQSLQTRAMTLKEKKKPQFTPFGALLGQPAPPLPDSDGDMVRSKIRRLMELQGCDDANCN